MYKIQSCEACVQDENRVIARIYLLLENAGTVSGKCLFQVNCVGLHSSEARKNRQVCAARRRERIYIWKQLGA